MNAYAVEDVFRWWQSNRPVVERNFPQIGYFCSYKKGVLQRRKDKKQITSLVWEVLHSLER